MSRAMRRSSPVECVNFALKKVFRSPHGLQVGPTCAWVNMCYYLWSDEPRRTIVIFRPKLSERFTIATTTHVASAAGASNDGRRMTREFWNCIISSITPKGEPILWRTYWSFAANVMTTCMRVGGRAPDRILDFL